MKYQQTIEYLYGLQKHGMKFGLDNITRLMEAFGNPHRSFRSVHVAGTNGKGSTSSMLESILRTGGLTTGLFTSPHLVSFTERIRINGAEIPESDVIDLADEVRNISEGIKDFSPTFFEVVTTMAFLYFSRNNVDWAVVEVGLGGRLDATNVIVPDISVITGIGFDHCEFLGNSLGEIAAEKAGIVKESVPVVTADQLPEALEVIARRSAERKSELFVYHNDFTGKMISHGHDGICFDYQGSGTYHTLRVPLSGEYQVVNASLAVKTAEIISERYPFLQFDIRRGLDEVKWSGRLEIIQKDPPILIDGAHNPSAALSLSRYLEKVLSGQYRRIILVMGVMGDKDAGGILTPLLPLASEIIFSAPGYGRAASPAMLAACASALGYDSITVSTIPEAIEKAESLYIPGDLIVVTGSFYTIGEVKELLGNKGILSRLRE